MKLAGLQKTTLIDFPGKVACTVFTIGCNFACPFCHNKDLITLELFSRAKRDFLSGKDFFSFLKRRKKILDGVCVTGGEPTLQKDLIFFLAKIKRLGLEVKLDTNASQPKVVQELIKKNLVDFWAVDFKTIWENYFQVTGFKKIAEIKKSLKLILASGKPLELRTTIVPGIHDEKMLLAMARELREIAMTPRTVARRDSSEVAFMASFSWKWNNFQPKNTLDPAFEKIKPYSEGQIKKLASLVADIFPVVE